MTLDGSRSPANVLRGEGGIVVEIASFRASRLACDRAGDITGTIVNVACGLTGP